MLAEALEARFEDPRLFAWRLGLWCWARAVPVAKEGESEQVLGCLDDRARARTG
jgi:hypothetical protein